ncbi:MAG: T9SS type A sorting domain-containing protein [Cytophagales bacterium]
MKSPIINILVTFAFVCFADNKLSCTNNENVKKSETSSISEKSKYIQFSDIKKKNYSIHATDGKIIQEGELDLNGNVDITSLPSGNYLIVFGKKAFQFAVK